MAIRRLDKLTPAPHKEIIEANSESSHYTVIYYFDQKYHPCEKSKASIGISHEYDDHGRSVRREYLSIEGGEVLPSSEPAFNDEEILADLALLKQKRLENAEKQKLERRSNPSRSRQNRNRPRKSATSDEAKAKTGARKQHASSPSATKPKGSSAEKRRTDGSAGRRPPRGKAQGASSPAKKDAAPAKQNTSSGIRRRPRTSASRLPGATEANRPPTPSP